MSAISLYLVLRDTNPEMVMAWLEYFADEGPWTIGAGDILRAGGEAIVSPANSYGYMDGGIDLVYRNFFGLGLQNRLQALLQEKYGGFLPVGEAVVISTQHERIPYLVAAPTMEKPGDVSRTDNAYRAMKACLLKTLEYNRRQMATGGKIIQRLLVPGLATGVGGMDPFTSAEQMRRAWDEVAASTEDIS
jgi:O-acetyl-ADP-ribose deacetylase (regulator of RNase III)